MKFNFRKITSVIASAVMLGSTLGIAAAASYPAPFISGGAADVAVVVGANAASSDYLAAVDIGQNLQAELAKQTATSGGTTGATASGGDSYKLEKTSTKFQLGNGILDVASATITKSNLPILLKDGTYVDDDNDEFDYTQKIELANSSVTMFDDNDYKADTPTVGIRIANAAHVLNYTITFSATPTWTDLTSTNLNILGKSYFILSTDAPTNTTMTLLDSAVTETLNEGESKTITVNGKEYIVSIAFITTNEVKLTINGQTTNVLNAAETQKLSDGAYVGIKTVSVQNYAGGTKQVEFSIGSGKLKLVHGNDIEMNDDVVSRLKGYVGGQSADKLTSITLSWDADKDKFVAADSSPEMPSFGAVKLSFGGMTYPEVETIVVEEGSDAYMVLKNFPLKDTTTDINLVWQNDSKNITGIGKDADEILRTSSPIGSSNITFDADTDSYFVASFHDTSNSESYLMRATNFKTTATTYANKTTIQYRTGVGDAATWTVAPGGTDAVNGDTISIGNVDFVLGMINYSASSVVIRPSSTAVDFNTLYSNAGLKVELPYYNETVLGDAAVDCADANFGAAQVGMNLGNTTCRPDGTNTTCLVVRCYKTTWPVLFTERDKSGTVANGPTFNATIGYNSASTPQLSVTAVARQGVQTETFKQQQSTKMWENHVYSALATKLLWDKSADQYALTAEYHGSESFANVFLAGPGVSVTEGTTGTGTVTTLGSVTKKDSELSSTDKAKNLVVIGGSCINSVAAEILGGSYCEADFTTNTGVGANQFLVKVITSPYATDKVAMLVAGYEAADTLKAVEYVTKEVPVTDVGTTLKKVTATYADVA